MLTVAASAPVGEKGIAQKLHRSIWLHGSFLRRHYKQFNSIIISYKNGPRPLKNKHLVVIRRDLLRKLFFFYASPLNQYGPGVLVFPE